MATLPKPVPELKKRVLIRISGLEGGRFEPLITEVEPKEPPPPDK